MRSVIGGCRCNKRRLTGGARDELGREEPGVGAILGYLRKQGDRPESGFRDRWSSIGKSWIKNEYNEMRKKYPFIHEDIMNQLWANHPKSRNPENFIPFKRTVETYLRNLEQIDIQKTQNALASQSIYDDYFGGRRKRRSRSRSRKLKKRRSLVRAAKQESSKQKRRRTRKRTRR